MVECCTVLYTRLQTWLSSISSPRDGHRVDADPDSGPALHFDADPDQDPYPGAFPKFYTC